MNVEIITIGDELLIGQVVDTNSAWMGGQLERENFRIMWKTTVGDDEAHLLDAVDRAMKRAQIVLLTGGIGPTKDDITRDALCRYFGGKLYFSEDVYENILRIFGISGRAMNPLTRNQALVPDACTVIMNLQGTAPCTWFERDGKVLVSMPGVPYEMKWLMTNEVIPRLKNVFSPDIFIRHRTLWVNGFSESALALKLERFEEELPPFVKLAYLPQSGLVRLRLSARTDCEEEAGRSVDEQEAKLCSLLAGHIFAGEDKTPEVALGDVLLAGGLTVGVAESCTGGRIASLITSVPGCSRYFAGSVVSYSNDLKRKLLGVQERDLAEHGAVSRVVVEQMALGAVGLLGCGCAIATSGIAGPSGGTPAKPVGTVWIAATMQDRVVSECYSLGALREPNIARASNMALLMLLGLVNGQDGCQ
ncbi:MAG: CinA family nicotinamide mononucleotide deamidase-related protein [Tannerellaceae bacterium]|jgi:nicotinamide-nucleotide amidase|nr:CinA family nicotinamide mononucleotide deamidase-related protein [Tannerellaceae bacterium]